MGAAAALVSSALWALTSVMLASQSGRLRPVLMSAIRSTTASLFLIGLLLITKGFLQYDELTLAAGIGLCVSGILGQALGDTLYINALGFLGVTRTFPITNSAYPFLTFLFAVIILDEPVTWALPVGGALISVGITWIVLEQRRGDVGEAKRDALLRGVLFALTAAISWAAATVWLRWAQGDLGAIPAASLRIPAASAAVIATIALTGERGTAKLRGVTPRGAAIIALAGVLGTGIGSVLFIYAVDDIGAARTAFLTTSAPLFALPMGVLFLQERITLNQIAGTLVTIVGIWFVVDPYVLTRLGS